MLSTADLEEYCQVSFLPKALDTSDTLDTLLLTFFQEP